MRVLFRFGFFPSVFFVWDIVFGTRFLPSDREPPEEIGIAALPAFPSGYVAHLASSFRWEAVVRESAELEVSPPE